MAKQSRTVLSLTSEGRLHKLAELAEKAGTHPEIKQMAKLCAKAVSSATDALTRINDHAERARGDRRRTEFSREEYAAEGAHKAMMVELAALDNALGEIGTVQKNHASITGRMFREGSETDRQHFAEIRALVRQQCKTPANVNLFVRNNDAIVGKAVLSAPLLLSNSNEGEREKMMDMYLARHEPGLQTAISAASTAHNIVAEVGQSLQKKVASTVDLQVLNTEHA